MTDQLARYKSGRLEPEKQRKLAELGYDSIFQRLDELKAKMVRKHRMEQPAKPRRSPEKDSQSSPRSKSPATKDRKQSKRSPVRPEDEVVPITSKWSAENTNLSRPQLQWNKMFEVLKAYKRTHGSCKLVGVAPYFALCVLSHLSISFSRSFL